MAREVFSQPKQRMKVRRDAEPLRPDELILLRGILRKPEVDDYLDSAEVATKLGLAKQTVLHLAHSGAFNGPWGIAFKPAHNRLRIPVKGVTAYIERNALQSADDPQPAPRSFFVPTSALREEKE